MTHASSNRSRRSGHAPSPRSASPSILGIWRLGDVLHSSATAELSWAQPADAAGSPRWDYMIKRATGAGGPGDVEARRQVTQFVAAATAVVHPNVIPVLDASTTASSPYLVMPRLQGQTMQAMMTSATAKPLPVALWLVRQVAQALAAIHAAGWIHGDVKPDNVMVGPRGHVTLIDLGFASRVHTVPQHHYRGTPAYSAPESMAGEMASMASMDVFSLGRLLWQWLTCIEPVAQIVLEPVADLIEGMVSEDPAQRPAAEEVVNQLLRLEIETLGRHIGPSYSSGKRRAA